MTSRVNIPLATKRQRDSSDEESDDEESGRPRSPLDVIRDVNDESSDDDEDLQESVFAQRRSPRLPHAATAAASPEPAPASVAATATDAPASTPSTPRVAVVPDTPPPDDSADGREKAASPFSMTEACRINTETLNIIIANSSNILTAVREEAKAKLASYHGQHTSIAVVGALGVGKSYTINCLVASSKFLAEHNCQSPVGSVPLKSSAGILSCTNNMVSITHKPGPFQIAIDRYTFTEEKRPGMSSASTATICSEFLHDNLDFAALCTTLDEMFRRDLGIDAIIRLSGPFDIPEKITLYDTPGLGDQSDNDEQPYNTPLMRHLLTDADVLAIVSMRRASREEITSLIGRGALSGVLRRADNKTPVVLSIYRADERDVQGHLQEARRHIERAIDQVLSGTQTIAGVEFRDDQLWLVDAIRRNVTLLSSVGLDQRHDGAVRVLENVRELSLTNIASAALSSVAKMLFSHLKLSTSAANYSNPKKHFTKRWNKLVEALHFSSDVTVLHESDTAQRALEDATERLHDYFEENEDVVKSPSRSAGVVVHYSRGFLKHSCVHLVVQHVVDSFQRFAVELKNNAKGNKKGGSKAAKDESEENEGLYAAFVLDEDELNAKIESSVLDVSEFSQSVATTFAQLFAAKEDLGERRRVLWSVVKQEFLAIINTKKATLLNTVRDFLTSSFTKLSQTIQGVSSSKGETREEVHKQIKQLTTMIRDMQVRRRTAKQMVSDMPRQDPNLIVEELRKLAITGSSATLRAPASSPSPKAAAAAAAPSSARPTSPPTHELAPPAKSLSVKVEEASRPTKGIPSCLLELDESVVIVSAVAARAEKAASSGWTFSGPISKIKAHLQPGNQKIQTTPVLSILTPNVLPKKLKILDLVFGERALNIEESRSVFLVVDARFPQLADITETITKKIKSATSNQPMLGFLVITGDDQGDTIASCDMCTNAMRFFASGALCAERFWFLEPGISDTSPVWNPRGLYSVTTPIRSSIDRTERDWLAILAAKEKSQRLALAKLSTPIEVDFIDTPDKGVDLLESILRQKRASHPSFKIWVRGLKAVNRAAMKVDEKVLGICIECVRELSQEVDGSLSAEHLELRAIIDDILAVDSVDKQLVAMGWMPSPFQVHTILSASPKTYRFARNYRDSKNVARMAGLRGAVLFNSQALRAEYAGPSPTGGRAITNDVSGFKWENDLVDTRRKFLNKMCSKNSHLAVMINFFLAPTYAKAAKSGQESAKPTQEASPRPSPRKRSRKKQFV